MTENKDVENKDLENKDLVSRLANLKQIYAQFECEKEEPFVWSMERTVTVTRCGDLVHSLLKIKPS